MTNQHTSSSVGKNCILPYIDVYNQMIPDDVVLHGLKQADGKFVCRIYGVNDNPKENKLFGYELTGSLWDEGDAHNLWFAKIYEQDIKRLKTCLDEENGNQRI